jgi:hypothetical protein
MPTHDLTLQTGNPVPANGIYEIFHAPHLLAQQVVLFKSEKFPRCSRCDSPVTFLLHHAIRALDYVDNLDVRVPLVELEPISLEDSAQNSPAQLREEM